MGTAVSPDQQHHTAAAAPRTAVQLAAANSLFPRQLAEFWRTKGVRAGLVTRDLPDPESEQAFDLVLTRNDVMPRGARGWLRARLIHSAHLLERALVAPFRSSYHRRTGRPRSEGWYPWFVGPLFDSGPLARAALSLEPMFTFGHEVTSYGPAVARCRGVPRILFPWGGDVFLHSRTSPFLWLLARSALRSVDLVLPSSSTAARWIQESFRMPAGTVRPLSWGVDRQMFHRATPAQRERILAQWSIQFGAAVVLNVRQFHPLWGCHVALEAFLALAPRHPKVHFMMLGGVRTEALVAQARRTVSAAGLDGRITVVDDRVPLTTVAELMSVADVFTSLKAAGDMRSASVLQATAAGAVPVLSDAEEYREMERLGFRAHFVDPQQPAAVAHAVAEALSAPEAAAAIRHANERYIAQHEDQSLQLERMWQLIRELCNRRASPSRRR
jgi:glycosyltransferase involved in cell wall biosynthesis